MKKSRIASSVLHQRAEEALRNAVQRVIDENARLGLPIYVDEDGKVVDIGPEEAARRGYPVKNRHPA